MKVSVLGLGFVGLTTAVGLAKHGSEVCGYDIVDEKRALIAKGETPFLEQGLNEALDEVLKDGSFKVAANLRSCLEDAHVIFLCMGTPMGEDGKADLSFILEALGSIAKNLKVCAYCPIVVVKSTVPPSSSLKTFKPYLEAQGLKVESDGDIRLANNPEFLREGFAYSDFMDPDRIVIGTADGSEYQEIRTIYEPFKAPLIFTNLNTAEFIKYLSNTTLATLISYANDLSLIAAHIGDIEIRKAFKVLSMDKRFHGSPSGITSYIFPGLGFGGYCLPKDTFALLKKGEESGYSSPILKAVLDINASIVNERLQEVYAHVPMNAKILVMGLSFKPGSDDIRDSRSRYVIEELKKHGYENLLAYDPVASNNFKKAYNLDISYESDLKKAVTSAECLILATAWDEIVNAYHAANSKYKFDFRFMS